MAYMHNKSQICKEKVKSCDILLHLPVAVL